MRSSPQCPLGCTELTIWQGAAPVAVPFEQPAEERSGGGGGWVVPVSQAAGPGRSRLTHTSTAGAGGREGTAPPSPRSLRPRFQSSPRFLPLLAPHGPSHLTCEGSRWPRAASSHRPTLTRPRAPPPQRPAAAERRPHCACATRGVCEGAGGGAGCEEGGGEKGGKGVELRRRVRPPLPQPPLGSFLVFFLGSEGCLELH